jgi:hypothetical protein
LPVDQINQSFPFLITFFHYLLCLIFLRCTVYKKRLLYSIEQAFLNLLERRAVYHHLAFLIQAGPIRSFPQHPDGQLVR